MSPRAISTFLLTATLFARTPLASALTVEQSVSPTSVHDDPKAFSVTVEKRPDGLLHFTITHNLTKPRYLVSTTEIRHRRALLLQTVSAAYVREPSATFYVTVSPEALADTKFQVSESFFKDIGQSVAEPGTIVLKIELGEFAKGAGEAKK